MSNVGEVYSHQMNQDSCCLILIPTLAVANRIDGRETLHILPVQLIYFLTAFVSVGHKRIDVLKPNYFKSSCLLAGSK